MNIELLQAIRTDDLQKIMAFHKENDLLESGHLHHYVSSMFSHKAKRALVWVAKCADRNEYFTTNEIPLNVVVAGGDVQLVKYILEAGINPNQVSGNGIGPCHQLCSIHSSWAKTTDIAQLLIQYGMNPHCTFNNRLSGYEYLIGNGHIEIANYVRSAWEESHLKNCLEDINPQPQRQLKSRARI